MSVTITVIIPTTCEKQREAQLLAAIESIKAQSGIAAKILLVVNGSRFDAPLLAQLRERDDVCVEYREVGSLPLALEYGCTRVDTEFFCFLDDDDELLEGS